jgi:prephenate dehydrogenase
MKTDQSKRVGVIGGSQGMGRWLVNFLSGKGLQVSFSSNDEHSQFASNSDLVGASDVVILAVPISKMERVLAEIYPGLAGQLLIDVCSVKSGIVAAYQRVSEQQKEVEGQYLSIHPMFAPSVKSVEGQVVIFNYASRVEEATQQYWKGLFASEGALVQDITYDEHDRLMGVIQGLNHFNVFVSAKTLAHMGADLDFIKTLSSPTYRIFLLFYTRYVLQNPRLYAEIQIFNPFVKEVTQLFMKEAQILLTVVENGDFEGFENYVKEIQPFFANNRGDSVISDKLIDALGHLLSDTQENKE